MMRSVYLKTLYDKRLFIIGWTLAFLVFAVLMTSFYPAFHQTGVFESFTKQLPKAFQGLIGNLADLNSFPTYLASQLFDIRLPLIAGIMAIILGMGLSTTEEESGELRTILALPIGRTQLLFQKWLALCTVTFITSLGLFAGVYLILPFLNDVSLDSMVLVRLVFVTWVLTITYGTITFAAGMSIGKRGPANAIGVVVIIGSFLLSTFGQSVDWLEKYEKLSLLHYFPAVDVAKNGINVQDICLLLAVTAVALMIAWLRFRRRDIA